MQMRNFIFYIKEPSVNYNDTDSFPTFEKDISRRMCVEGGGGALTP